MYFCKQKREGEGRKKRFQSNREVTQNIVLCLGKQKGPFFLRNKRKGRREKTVVGEILIRER